MTRETALADRPDWMEQVGRQMTDALVQRLGDEVDLVFEYGSRVKGTAHRYSDLDLSFVPAHDRSGGSITVLVNGTLFDLYPIRWSTLEEMAAFENVSSSLLLTCRPLYTRNASVEARFRSLADRLRERLMPEAKPLAIQTAQRLFQRTAYPYFLLRLWAGEGEAFACIQQTQSILGTVFHCLAVANQACIDTRKVEQVCALAELPEGFAETARRVVQSCRPEALLTGCEALLFTTRRFLAEQGRRYLRRDTRYTEVCRAVYPEMRSALDKVALAAERNDLLLAKTCVASALEELMMRVAQVQTGEEFSSFHGAGDYEQDLSAFGFPALLPPLVAGDLTELRVRAIAFDQHLRQFLAENGVALNDFASVEELRTALDAGRV